MDALFETVRDACSRSVWSQGVELARGGSVIGERADENEVVLRVSPLGRVVSPTVVLYPADEEWECDCRSAEDPCVHVAAAVIFARRARREGGSPESADSSVGRLRYCFRRDGDGLSFERYVVRDGREELAPVGVGAGEAAASANGEPPRREARPRERRCDSTS